MNLDGIAAVVSGGASGLGAATCRALVAGGARVSLFDLNVEAGCALAAELGGQFFAVDVSDAASVAAGLSGASAAHGIPRVFVNCAGLVAGERTARPDRPHAPNVFDRVIGVNLVGTFNCMTQAAALMATLDPLDEERGVIINTASIAAYEGQIGQLAYAASKAAVVGMTLPAARDLAEFGVRVVSIAPGLFLTPMVSGLPPAVQDSLGRQSPFPRRLGAPAEFAQLVRAIVENPMINGETIRIDAALRMAAR
ncbi:SDR family NAD(P)-dependent oxidoreductase [Phenylobacterium sp. LH3H17]|uniref:SDR family NAD(P)-dependent oxidoreductase n=1 Tax=Phenylobacterium sp. LH3H17 TaxID=2903901 RepID=UPI0020C93D7C|nr:SDR family NAD(P)-dependent oxidoreductase [Phenylobacterium sp. LH3H17]UTP38269.1 SDR family NAD(P)-dependent oxidoreductase [Phenylobacterium sp. LH3H17]